MSNLARLGKKLLGETTFCRLYIKVTHKGLIVNPDLNQCESGGSLVAEARKRWTHAKPDSDLTWHREISGDAFIKRLLKYYKPDSSTNILEIGPGYGRLLKAILNEGLAFKNYCGIDMSEENIDYLRRTFTSSNIYFAHGNAEDIELNDTFDLAVSSLTFKHMYPSYEKALSNMSRFINQNGMVLFDLIEGNLAAFTEDGTYIRFYKKTQIEKIVQRSGFELVGFDKVVHAPGFSRLLVIAQKPR